MLLGPVANPDQYDITSLFLSIAEILRSTLKEFWEHEELPIVHRLSSEDSIAEDIHKTTTSRLSSGRFMVAIIYFMTL